MKHITPYIALLMLIALSITGCASRGPSFGDTIQEEGNAVAGIGEKWEKGQALVRKGNRLIRKGNERIAEGKENVADGTAMVKSGEKLVADAESEYSQIKSQGPGN